MKIWILSDLHHSLTPSMSVAETVRMAVPKADLCVLAGDLCDNFRAGMDWVAREIASRMPVVMVLGNHDFYGHDVPSARREAADLARAGGIVLLDDTSAEIDGVTFAGSTLWTDFMLFESQGLAGEFSRSACMFAAKQKFADFDEIWATEASDRQMARLLTPRDAVRLHEESTAFLSGLRHDPSRKLVVVTHHAPSMRSVPEEFRRLPTTASFASVREDLMLQVGADLWVHGHIHQNADYVVGRTRVVCNPRGIPANANRSFDPAMVMEV